jgi:pimeloyl-ACP methyl ester carboxylesterase
MVQSSTSLALASWLVLSFSACSATALATPPVAKSPQQVAALRSGYAPVDGLQIYYEVYGQARDGSPPLILMHGGDPTIQTSFADVLPLLAQSRQVIAFEQQGHGHTADRLMPYSFTRSADDAAGLLKHLGIKRADFLGYSNGGHIAIEIGLRHPDLVRKLIIESAMFNREGAPPQFWEGFTHAKIEDMPKGFREAFVAAAPHPEELQTYFEKSVTRMREFKGWQEEQIRSIDAPTLVLSGDRDIVLPEHAALMSRLLPHGSLAILPMTDHMQMAKRADWVASIVKEFLDAPMPK